MVPLSSPTSDEVYIAEKVFATLIQGAPGPMDDKTRFKEVFRSDHYLQHNQRRQEHLASLNLPIAGRSVLELGAGIGDHTTFFLDRNCTICVTDGRPEHIEILRDRFEGLRIELINLDDREQHFQEVYEIVYAYGILYHLTNPEHAIAQMAKWCSDLLLLETCVSTEDHLSVSTVEELKEVGSQAISGTGCRPSRHWVFAELGKHFSYVYTTVTQPWHLEFPTDWDAVPPDAPFTRAVFVASRAPLNRAAARHATRATQAAAVSP